MPVILKKMRWVSLSFVAMAKKDGKEVAGIMGMTPETTGMPPMWGAYVTVDNVENSAKQVKDVMSRNLRHSSCCDTST